MSNEQEKTATQSNVGSQELTEETIRERAYALFEQRGCESGHELEDWLQAETEIKGKKPVSRGDLKPVREGVVAA
jgi:hypothetical protein